MPNKLISLQDAVSRYTRDGMVYASGAGLPVGSDSLVFGREMLRQGRKGIHYLTHCCSQQVNLFCAAGVCDKVEAAFSGLEVYGFAQGVRRAVESGRVLWEDWSNLAMSLRFLGGALRWPFVPATVNIGSDLQYCSAFKPDEYPCKTKIPDITDPFTGKIYGALPVARPELAVIHVTMADAEGNAIFLGTEWSRFELARAADQVVLQADFIVDTDCMRQYPNLVRIPDLLVEAVIPWQLGAWPQCSVGVYDSDAENMILMNRMLGTEQGTEEFKARFIDSWKTEDEYLAMIGEEKIKKITTNDTTHLMDPYRKWIKSSGEIKELMKQSKFNGGGGDRMDFTRQEMMAIATGREIRDGDLCIFGVGLSMLAGYFALAYHAPNAKAMTEGGVYGSSPVGGLPWGIEDNRISANATCFTGAIDALGFLVASGKCDLGIIGAAQVDKFCNVNTTGFWENPGGNGFGTPKTRLNGSGGANDIACGCKRVVVMLAHEKKRFAEKVDYITTPGYLEGGNARSRYHFVGGGPVSVITTLGILRPDNDTKELMLDSYFPFSSIEEMKANTNWDLKVSPNIKVVPEPTADELQVLRSVDTTGMLKKK